ncbi:MAG: hypothetical protein QY314_03955 [Candidatus Dojkabacteria bacterium]|nr:MAG: hypothetical protein QY314_03955 [Candidatus Dojkabacteria bacterium]
MSAQPKDTEIRYYHPPEKDFEPVALGREVLPGGKFAIITTVECPEEVKDTIRANADENEGMFLAGDFIGSASRRVVTRLNSREERPHAIAVVKRKAQVPQDGYMRRFTTFSLVNEIRMAHATNDIIDAEGLRDYSVMYQDQEVDIQFDVQVPFGGVYGITPETRNQRYGLFQFHSGTSVRDEVAMSYGWNHLTQEERLLYGNLFHGQLTNLHVAAASKYGIYTHDLGVHQLLYNESRNDGKTKYQLTILDTEEFYPCEPFVPGGLFPVICFL